MFRNVCFLRCASAWPESEEELDEALVASRFEPCGPLSEKSFGWEAPVDDGHGRLCRSVGGADLIQLRTQSRLLPAAAVNEVLETRLEEFRERTGDMPGRREKRRLKVETRDNLLPKALLRSERTKAVFLRPEKILLVDAATPAKVERLADMLRFAFGKFETSELAFRQPVGGLLTRIFLGDAPPEITIGRECRMQDPSDSKATVRFADMDLADANIRRHVRDGMVLTHLDIEFDGLMSCVIDDKGRLGKLRIAGMDIDESGAGEDPLMRFDAEFMLLTATVKKFFGVLTKVLGKV
jgi:recombination associated protein RdgC